MLNKKRTLEEQYIKICKLTGVNPNLSLLKEQQELVSGGNEPAPRPDDMGPNAYMLLNLEPGMLDQATKFSNNLIQPLADKLIYNDFEAKKQKKTVSKWKPEFKSVVKWYEGDKAAIPANLISLIKNLQAKGMPVLGSEFGQTGGGGAPAQPTAQFTGELVLGANNKIDGIQLAKGLTYDKTGNTLLPFVKTKNAILIFNTGTNASKVKIEFVATVVPPDAMNIPPDVPKLERVKDLFADDSDQLNKDNAQYKTFINLLVDYMKKGGKFKGVQIESSTSKVPSTKYKDQGGNETLAKLRAESLKNAITEDMKAAGYDVTFLEPIIKPEQGPDWTPDEYFVNGKFVEEKKGEYNDKYGPFRYVSANVVV
jgi:hypothetical protein